MVIQTARKTIGLALCAGICAAGASEAQADSGGKTKQIGAVSAAQPDIKGTPPQSRVRELSIGTQVVRDERVITGPSGVGQVLFIDQTGLTIAPDSDITLDKYVYDPDRDIGDISATVTKGALRFVGGRITKKTPAKIRVKSTTIAIRGGMAFIALRDDGSIYVFFQGGLHLTIEAGGKKLVINRNGGQALISADGLPTALGRRTTGQGESSQTGDAAQTGDATQTAGAGQTAGDGPKITYLGIANADTVKQLFRIFAVMRPTPEGEALRRYLESNGKRLGQTSVQRSILSRGPVRTNGSDTETGSLDENGVHPDGFDLLENAIDDLVNSVVGSGPIIGTLPPNFDPI